ncbi:MAG: N-acetylglucosamine kinase, partial [Marinilabiliales bacterium]
YPNTNAFVNTDIYGAALSLLHDQKGIAAILGTGMNACLFDGKNIVKTIPSLGYIIGDEGSGSYFGKKLLNKIFTKDIDKTLIEKFHHRYQLSREDIIKNTYGKERANKFLASFCPFIHDNKLHSDLQTMLMEGFNGFYRKYISHISQNDSIYFTGSIAHYFKEELIESAECYGYKVMEVMKSPMDGLIKYHSI